MEAVITGKGVEITPALRSYTESKLNKLDRIVSDVMDVHVTLGVQKYLQIAELTVKTRNGGFSASAQTTDMFASINEAIDNLARQARRQNKRIKSKKGHRRPARTDVWEAPEPLEAGEQIANSSAKLRRKRVPIKPMSVEEAALQVRSADEGFLVFRNASSNNLNIVHRRDDGDIDLIEPGE